MQYGLLKFDIRNTLSVVAIGSSCTTAGRTVAEMVAATAGATATITPCIYRVTEHAVHRVILAKAHFTFTASKSALVKQRMFCNIYEQLTKLCQHNESHNYIRVLPVNWSQCCLSPHKPIDSIQRCCANIATNVKRINVVRYQQYTGHKVSN